MYCDIHSLNSFLQYLISPSLFKLIRFSYINTMRYQHLNSIHPLISDYLQKHITPGDTVIDATLGNGFDTLKIAEILDGSGKIYGFDIQPLAIENSRKLLASLPEPKPTITLIEASHADFEHYIHEKIDFIIYNLGYLPKGDKEITTQAESTIQSVQSGLSLLRGNGIMLIESFLSALDQKQFNVLKQQFINQKNSPPFIYVIEKANNHVE